MSIYICRICEQQKDGDFNCAELDGKECCEECFANAWNATHEKPKEKFEANPWVWSILFEVVK